VRHKKEGKGEMSYGYGEVYTGEWVQDIRHGQGTYIWPTNVKYELPFPPSPPPPPPPPLHSSLPSPILFFYLLPSLVDTNHFNRYSGQWVKGIEEGNGILEDPISGNVIVLFLFLIF
jgi:hypothetical protein